jgi:hypothetical protein
MNCKLLQGAIMNFAQDAPSISALQTISQLFHWLHQDQYLAHFVGIALSHSFDFQGLFPQKTRHDQASPCLSAQPALL